jgi:hypothetical protein
MPPYPLRLYPSRYRDARTGKWRRARYRAELHEIRARHADFEIAGAPMLIHEPISGTFNPAGNAATFAPPASGFRLRIAPTLQVCLENLINSKARCQIGHERSPPACDEIVIELGYETFH